MPPPVEVHIRKYKTISHRWEAFGPMARWASLSSFWFALFFEETVQGLDDQSARIAFGYNLKRKNFSRALLLEQQAAVTDSPTQDVSNSIGTYACFED